jgi:hypothetical protein
MAPPIAANMKIEPRIGPTQGVQPKEKATPRGKELKMLIPFKT